MDVQYRVLRKEFDKISTFQATLPEFDECRDIAEDILFRAERMNGVLFCAESEGEVVGMLFAYEEKKGVWYNHITGVVPSARKQGIATELLTEFEAYANLQGARRLTVKSMNRFPSMLRRLVAMEYDIVGVEGDKVLFSKTIA